MPSPLHATAELFSMAIPDPRKEGGRLIELGMFVTNPTKQAHRMMWGSTCTLIANAITGQTTGFTLPVYLLGAISARLLFRSSCPSHTHTRVRLHYRAWPPLRAENAIDDEKKTQGQDRDYLC